MEFLGSYVISASYDLNYSITSLSGNIQNNKFIYKHTYNTCQANRIVVSPDNKIAFATNPFTIIHEFPAQSHKPVIYTGHQINVTDIVFASPTTFFTCSEDRTIKVWQTSAQHSQQSISTNSALNCMAYIPESENIIVGNKKGLLEMYDLKNKSLSSSLQLSKLPVRSLSMFDKTIICVTQDGNGHKIIVKDGELVLDRDFRAHDAIALRCQIDPSGTMFVTTSEDSTAKLWDLNSLELKGIFKEELMVRWIWDACFTPDSKILCTGGTDKIIRAWEVETFRPLARFEYHIKGITALAILTV